MKDEEIIELFFVRDEKAISETEIKYGKLCHSIAYHILNNYEDSEECVNDTYLGLWNAIPPTRPNRLGAFVCKIVRNLSLKRFEAMTRQKRSHGMLVSLDELAEILPDESATDGVSEEEIGNLISSFLKKEKADIRHVFLRRYYFFDSVAEIAARYGFTENKVRNMLYHTRNKLKMFLMKEGIKL